MEDDETISLAEVGSVLGRALLGLIRGDVDVLELFTDDVVGDSPNTSVQSRIELEHQLSDRSEAISNIEFTIDHVEWVAPDFVVNWHMSGDHTGEMLLNEDQFFEPTGRRIEVHATTHVQFRTGRICAFQIAYDNQDLVEQLRGGPSPDERADAVTCMFDSMTLGSFDQIARDPAHQDVEGVTRPAQGAEAGSHRVAARTPA